MSQTNYPPSESSGTGMSGVTQDSVNAPPDTVKRPPTSVPAPPSKTQAAPPSKAQAAPLVPPPAPPVAPPQMPLPPSAQQTSQTQPPAIPPQAPVAPPAPQTPVAPQAIPALERPVQKQPAQNKRAAKVIPPPPPPRSTLPPVRRGPEISPRVSGVGSATAPRWRGELDSIHSEAEAKKAARRATLLAAETGRPIPTDLPEDEEEGINPAKAAPPWLVSTVFHLILFLILALITSPVGSGVSRVLLEMGFSERETSVELTEFTIDASDDISEDFEAIADAPVEVDVSEVLDSIESADASELAPTDIGNGVEAALIAKPMFNGRSGAMRKALLSIYGGTPLTEDAVNLGLKWLQRNQQRNGSWSMTRPYSDGGISENRTAATAMALLAFQGAGNTHKSGEYQKEVEKGIKYLIGQQGRDGFMAKNARGHEKMYAQAQATIALCELYAMTKDSWLRPRAQLAVDYAESAQSSEGGWRYEPRIDSDTSVTGWYVLGLKSALAAGLEVNDSKLRIVSDFLDSVSHFDDAAYSYQPRGAPSPAMTAEGLLCRQYLGWERNHPPMKLGIEALLLDAPFDLRDRDVYYWYYATQVLHHYGGEPWREWNEVMRVKLPASQVKRGRESGSWAPQGDQWGRNSGRLYTTCLSIFCLEVYYRHLPLYKSETHREKAKEEGTLSFEKP